jgi:hypothetical protein
MKLALTSIMLVAAVFCTTNVFAVPQIVTVSITGTGADYSNIAAAIGSINDASSSKPYEIFVYPGIYTGSNNGGAGLAWKSYVSLRGADRESTILRGHTAWATFTSSLIDFSNVQGVEVSNITLDGTAQIDEVWSANPNGDPSDFEGSICVGNASITFSHVRILNGNTDFTPAFTLNSGFDPCYSSGVGNVVVLDSDLGPVADLGGNWTFKSTTISATHYGTPDYIYAYARGGSEYNGNLTMIGCTLEARAPASANVSTNALWLGYAGSGEINIIGSTLIANNAAANPGGITAPIQIDGDATGARITVQGSLLYSVSQAGVSTGEFYGVYQAEESDVPVILRASTVKSFGSGGTRADVYNDAAAENVNIEATAVSSVAGDFGTTTADSHQGQYSSDLIIPLISPTLGPVNGQVWIDTGTNRLCYRSGGTTRCLTGS